MQSSLNLNFSSLDFKKPFTEKSHCPQYQNRQVFLPDCTGIPGIVVTRYNWLELQHYSFSKIQTSLNNGAKRIYTLLLEKRVAEIAFALIPITPEKQAKVLNDLMESFFLFPLNENYPLLKSFFLDSKKEFYLDLCFEKPFLVVENEKKFQLNRWKHRPGIYFLEETIYSKGKVSQKEIVYIGKSETVLWQRVRDKFYRNPHLFYEEIPGEKEYKVAMVQIFKENGESENDLVDKINNYEKELIKYFNPRDNKLGKITDSTLEVLKWPGFANNSFDELPF